MRGRGKVDSTRRGTAQTPIDIVAVAIDPVGETGDAGGQIGVVGQTAAAPFRIRCAAITALTNTVDDLAGSQQGNRIRRAILQQVRIGAYIVIAVRGRSGIRADHKVVARGQGDSRQRQRCIGGRATAIAVDQKQL